LLETLAAEIAEPAELTADADVYVSEYFTIYTVLILICLLTFMVIWR
tara:strand:+ start:1615 stop:1755 length:141 start_codon:yes stop_codon:yes gene_type:complete